MKKILSMVIFIFTPFFSVVATNDELYINYENLKIEVINPSSVTHKPEAYYNTINFENKEDSLLASTIDGEIILKAKLTKFCWLKNIKVFNSSSDTITRLTENMLEFLRFSYSFQDCEQVECELKITVIYPFLVEKEPDINKYLNWLPYNYKVQNMDYVTPQKAQKLGFEGKSLLNVFIDDKGELDSIETICSDGEQLTKFANDVINNIEYRPLYLKDSIPQKYRFSYLFNSTETKSHFFSFYETGKLYSQFHALSYSHGIQLNGEKGISYSSGYDFSVDYDFYHFSEFFNHEKNRKNGLASYYDIGIYFQKAPLKTATKDDKNKIEYISYGLKYAFGYGYSLPNQMILGLLYRESLPFSISGSILLDKNSDEKDINNEKLYINQSSEMGLLLNYKNYFVLDLSYNYQIFFNRRTDWSKYPELIVSMFTTYLFRDLVEDKGYFWIPAADFIIKSALSYSIYNQLKRNPNFLGGPGGESIWVENIRIGIHFPFGILWAE
jgi:hypothetical protein